MDATKTRALMELLPEIYNTSVLTDEYHRYFETALGFWLSGGGHPEKKFDYYKFSSYMGGSLDRTVVPDRVSTNLSRAQGNNVRNLLFDDCDVNYNLQLAPVVIVCDVYFISKLTFVIIQVVVMGTDSVMQQLL